MGVVCGVGVVPVAGPSSIVQGLRRSTARRWYGQVVEALDQCIWGPWVSGCMAVVRILVVSPAVVRILVAHYGCGSC